MKTRRAYFNYFTARVSYDYREYDSLDELTDAERAELLALWNRRAQLQAMREAERRVMKPGPEDEAGR